MKPVSAFWCCRDNREKTIVKLDELETKIPELLQAVHDGLYERALKNRQNRTFTATTFEEMKRLASEESGFLETMWCGDLECEMKVKEEAGLTSAACPMSRSTSAMSARSAASPPSTASSGARLIKSDCVQYNIWQKTVFSLEYSGEDTVFSLENGQNSKKILRKTPKLEKFWFDILDNFGII